MNRQDYDEVTAKRLIEAVKAGNTIRAAAKVAGVSMGAVRRWLIESERESSTTAFHVRIERAEAEAEAAAVATVRDAAHDHWQAAAWWLERRRPRAWSKRELVPKTADAKKFDGMTDVELQEALVAHALDWFDTHAAVREAITAHVEASKKGAA
jgi:transposase